MKITCGPIVIEPDTKEDLVYIAAWLVQPVGDKEIATMLTVSDRTVRRWRVIGRLPRRPVTTRAEVLTGLLGLGVDISPHLAEARA